MKNIFRIYLLLRYFLIIFFSILILLPVISLSKDRLQKEKYFITNSGKRIDISTIYHLGDDTIYFAYNKERSILLYDSIILVLAEVAEGFL